MPQHFNIVGKYAIMGQLSRVRSGDVIVYHSISRRLWTGLCCAALILGIAAACVAAPARQVLVISVTKGFQHSAIPLGEEILKELGTSTGLWQVDYARTDEELAKKTTPAALKNYSVLVFNNTTGDLPLADREAFLDWVRAGGGVVGIHAATDTFHGWPDYIELIGGQFLTHGPQSEVEFKVQDIRHPSTRTLPRSFKAMEEIYLFKNFSRSDVRVLIALDKHPNTGEPGEYPVSWVRDYGKGRVFYTSIGHREDLLGADVSKKHILGGMRWALGLVSGDATPIPLSPVEKSEGFRALFNNKDLTGWHYRNDGRNPWVIKDGILSAVHGGADLVTDEKFRDFTIRYEYRVPKGGNSGVYLRGRYEIQVLDDFEGRQPSTHGNGSIYGKIAPSKFASKSTAEWQTAEATIVGNVITVILNGELIIDKYKIDGPTGGALDGNVDQPGPIMLQGDHGPMEYRNIRIKPL